MEANYVSSYDFSAVNLYTMKPLETIYVSDPRDELAYTEIIRVPGGWIISEVFVPFNNEFMQGEER